MTAQRQKQTSKNCKISRSGDETPPNHAKIAVKPRKPRFPEVSNFNLDNLADSLSPPRYLYKYLSAERVGDVLETGTVRFTPLVNTNDSFEVRSTFNKIMGPKFHRILIDEINSKNEDFFREEINRSLKDKGLDGFSKEFVFQFIKKYYGNDFVFSMKAEMKKIVDERMVPYFNNSENIEKLLENLGRRILCFSLSERMDSAPMWAHYAANNSGFVAEFDTNHDWFYHRKDGQKTKLHKVKYFDGMLDEMIDDMQVAFISKTLDWSYECEWRLNLNINQIDKVLGFQSDPIYLLEFPPEIITRVILGYKTHRDTVCRIQEVLSAKYPHVQIFRVVPDRKKHTYNLDAVS